MQSSEPISSSNPIAMKSLRIAIAKSGIFRGRTIQLPCLLNHSFGQVNPKDIDFQIVEVARHMTRTTAEVTDQPTAANLFGEILKHFLIERLVVQFAINAAGVFVGDPVIRCFQVVFIHARFRQSEQSLQLCVFLASELKD